MTGRVGMATVLAAVLVAAVSGCGRGKPGLAKAELDARANALCTAAGRDIKAVPEPTDVNDPAQRAAYLDRVVPLVTRITDQLAALKPAGDVKADWDALIALQQQEDAAFIVIQRKADARDSSATTDLEQIPALNDTINAAATKVGATGCVD